MEDRTPPPVQDRNLLATPSLNRLLAAGEVWDRGPLRAVRYHRIGFDHGLSGRVYRIRAITADGSAVSLVAKLEAATEIARALAFRAANEATLGALILASYGAEIDHAADHGAILLEDIHGAIQGDDLRGCTRAQAIDIVTVVARVHAATRGDPDPDSLAARGAPVWGKERWEDRIAVAAMRYPDAYTPEVVAALAHLNDAAGRAIEALAPSAAAWTHGDCHPDNVLWRPGGRPVLIDWSGAQVAPPAIDVAVLLTSLAFCADPPLLPGELLERYTEELGRGGVPTTVAAITETARLALLPRLRGMVGWTGLHDDPKPARRHAALRAVAPGRVVNALRWLDAGAQWSAAR